MVICAAIKIRLHSSGKESVICGHRHGNCYYFLEDLNLKGAKDYSLIEEGFLISDGTFLNRKEALEHATTCGQLSKTTIWHKIDHEEDELYSEDLY